MNIDGLGEAAVEPLVTLGLVNTVAELYTLAGHADALISLDRWGEKSTQNLLDAIAASKRQPFDRVLFGLGIRHVGSGVAKAIAGEFSSIDDLQEASEERLRTTPQVGPTIAESVIHFFADRHNRDIGRRLKAAGVEKVGIVSKLPGEK